MASRHVFTQRLKSGVIFSAPGNLLAMPEGGWGDDIPINRPKRSRRKVQGHGLDHFSHWVAKVTPYDEPYDGIGSFTPVNDTRGIGNEYRPYAIAPYPEPEVEAAPAKIPEMTLCLPMLSVSLKATVDGTVAHTELMQKFHNPSDIIIDAAKHVFPVYDGAVITSFECTIGDERRVRGVVKPKVQARKEFEEAVRDKVAAPALLEEHTPEIFETSLGNIPAKTTVEIKTTYVQELKVVMMESEATEGIALTIPMSIAPRYSKAPIEWEPASRVPEERLDIWIKVLDNGKVNQEGCEEESGHLLQFEGSKPAEYINLLDKDASPKTYYVWHHESEPPILRKDFVFVVQMNEGHQIKSGAIACPADDKGLAALRVNIRPNDLFRNAIIPQSFTGEILFLLDQSGSMGWSNGSYRYDRRHNGGRKIDVMREAMLLALSGIPSTCVFNIISWGSATMGLWESSRAHTRENIREAKGYVSQIEADMGGTDLLRALESTVKRRVKDKSTQIIILTDGELEPEDSIQFIWKKRQLFGDSIRFFALGIGDEVSHRLVESIAECGGGYSDVVHTTQTPRWHDRLNRLLKSALEPNSWSCDIHLGSGFERKSLIDYKFDQQTTAESDKTPYIQAPFPISSLHPFSFASISFLIDLRHGGELPKSVTISTTTTGAKKKTYELPIEQAPGNDGTIHRLVAKSVLLDLQDEIKRGTAETHIAKANAENIGTLYSITSKWTSFVAISEDQPAQTVEEQKMNHYKALFDEIDIDELLNNVSDDESSSYGSTSGSSTNMAYGASQNPRMNMAGPPRSHYHMISEDKLMTGRVLESASGIPAPAYMTSSQTNLVDNNGRACPIYPTDSTPRQLHPMIHVQPAPDPKADDNNFCVSGQSLAYPSSPNNETTEAQQQQASRPYDGYPWSYSSDNGEDLLAHSSFGSKQSAGEPSGPSMRSMEPSPIPAHMPQYSPARPKFGMSLPPGFIDDSQGGRSALRQCSLDEDNDEPEALRPTGSQVTEHIGDADQEEPQGYGEKIRSLSSRFRSNSASGPRPWEVQESSDSRNQAIVIDYDTLIFPSARRFDDFEDGSSKFSDEDFGLIPNDSNQREAEMLGFMQGQLTDNSQPDLAPLTAEFAEPPAVAAVAANPSSYDSYAQKASTPQSSKPAYSVTSGSCRPRRRYVYDSEGNSNDDTAQDHQPYHSQRDDFSQEEFSDESLVSPRAKRGIAIATVNTEPEEPQELNDEPTPGLLGRLRSFPSDGMSTGADKLPTVPSSQETEVVERTLELPDTKDAVPPHDLVHSPTAEDSSVRPHRHYPLIRRPNRSSLYKTRNPPVVSSYQDMSFSHSPVDENRQIVTPKPPPPPSDSFLSRLAPHSVKPNNIPSGPNNRAPTTYNPPPPLPPPHVSATLSATYIPFSDASPVPWCPVPRPRSRPLRAVPSPIKTFEIPTGAPVMRRRKALFHSDHEEGSQSTFGSTPYQHGSHNPLDWQVAMECQDGQGLFELTDQARGTLRLHFCQETDGKLGPKITELVGSSPVQDQEDEGISTRLLDTLMMIECYKTHCAQEEDTWDLMMERAWDAVISILGLSQDEAVLEELASQLRAAMMHAHYVAATGVKDSEKDGSSVVTVRCPVCDVVWRTTRQFFCPFDHGSDNHADEFSSWADFWRHQVAKGHVVCAQEVLD